MFIHTYLFFFWVYAFPQIYIFCANFTIKIVYEIVYGSILYRINTKHHIKIRIKDKSSLSCRRSTYMASAPCYLECARIAATTAITATCKHVAHPTTYAQG